MNNGIRFFFHYWITKNISNSNFVFVLLKFFLKYLIYIHLFIIDRFKIKILYSLRLIFAALWMQYSWETRFIISLSAVHILLSSQYIIFCSIKISFLHKFARKMKMHPLKIFFLYFLSSVLLYFASSILRPCLMFMC